MDRKQMKERAKSIMKKHYWIFLLLCLMAGVIGVDYSDALDFTKIPSQMEKLRDGGDAEKSEELVDNGTNTVGMSLDSVYEALLNKGAEKAKSDSKELVEKAEKSDDKDYSFVQVGRRRGVMALIVNKVTSGSVYLTIYAGIQSLVGSENIATAIFILLSMIVVAAVWLLVTNYFKVILKRIYMEGRTYEELPFSRMLFLVRVRKVIKIVVTLTLETIFYGLWCLTIVGGVIKHYSYYLVPYIVAENPGISSRKAITLSRNMMKGHKWECFKLELSFLGWSVLSAVTFGLSGLFFSNPYMEATFCEYFAYLRKLAKENNAPDIELLNDTYLYEKAPADMVASVYRDIPAKQEFSKGRVPSRGKIAQFLCDTFGVILRYDSIEKEYQKTALMEIKYNVYQSILGGLSYPGRLYPVPESERKKKHAQSFLYLRHYSVTSLILMFFSLSLIGWLWEVSLHLISDGTFVNRGVLHGPWLPIYGTGGILILLALTKLRKKPWLEFLGGVLLAGVVEYFTAWNLEMTHDGQKWWDYSGYFLNLHGRICAEGLLVFGLGGLAIVYFVAPLLDNAFRKLSAKIVIPLCAVLLIVFAGDQMYSSKNPNTGDGITNYESGASSDTAEINSLKQGAPV